MNLKNKKVVVTGSGGFIGSHLSERLVKLGASVKALVHYNALGSWGWLDTSPLKNDLEIIQGDITDADCMINLIKGADIVYHLAALIAIPYSYKSPESYIKTNILGTHNILRAAQMANVSCLVQTSTSEVYGTALYIPIDEKHPLQGQSPYSASKIGSDKIAEAYHLSFQTPLVTIRPFNTYGPRQSNRAIIPTIITQCMKRDKITIGSLHPTRDLNFVEDTVNGFILASLTPSAIGKTINLGSGHTISIGSLAQKIISIAGKPVQIESTEERKRPVNSEVECLLAANQLAKETIGWEPKISLDQGLKFTFDWFKNNIHLYKSDQYIV